MAESRLIVLHGMGIHSAESVKESVIKAANTALKRYPGHKNTRFEQEVDVIGVGYDDLFEKERNRLSTNNQHLSDLLSGNNRIGPDFIRKIVALENRIGDNDFFATHAFDVILYLTLKGEEVRLRVIEKIAGAWSRRRNEDMHVLAHSLGTAVLHDTLHKAYTGGIKDTRNGKNYKLSCVNHKFDSLWMVANVSNLTARLSPFGVRFDPYKSVVKASDGSDGCTELFYNLRHKLDPFTLFYPFLPEPADGWVTPAVYAEMYSYIENERIGSTINPHDLTAYLLDPNVSYRFLKRVMPQGLFNPSAADAEKADAKFKDVLGTARRIGEHMSNIRTVDDIEDFVLMVKEFEEYIAMLKNGL